MCRAPRVSPHVSPSRVCRSVCACVRVCVWESVDRVCARVYVRTCVRDGRRTGSRLLQRVLNQLGHIPGYGKVTEEQSAAGANEALRLSDMSRTQMIVNRWTLLSCAVPVRWLLQIWKRIGSMRGEVSE